jgi:hypothetical protein
VLKFSPWGHQESIMIITAAERSALRQATPLGGLLGEGEEALIEGDEPQLNEEELIRDLIMELDIGVGLKNDLFEAIKELNAVSPNAWGIGRAQMTLPGRDDDSVEREIADIQRQTERARERLAREKREAVEVIQEAEVVEETPAEPKEEFKDGFDPLGGPGGSDGEPGAAQEPQTRSGRPYGQAPEPGDVAEAAGEAARGNDGPQEELRLNEAVGAGDTPDAYPCPNCEKDWNTEHTAEEQQACLRAYEQED